MSYTVQLTATTKLGKEAQAIEECKAYLGTAKFLNVRSKIVSFLVEQPAMRTTQTYRNVCLGCWAVGLNGYWVKRAVARTVLQSVKALRATRAQRQG